MSDPLREELRRELRQLVRPWKNSPGKPPFTAEELVVIGTVLSPCSCVTQGMVQQNIARSFAYYMNLSLACTARGDSMHYNSSEDTKHKANEFQRECAIVYRRFDIPIEHFPGRDDRLDKWSVTTSAARIFLEKRLTVKTREAQKPFPFMRLPAELRNRIYKLVLWFPKSGVCVKVRAGSSRTTHRIPARLSVMKDTPDFDGVGSWEVFEAYTDDLPTSSLLCPPTVVCLSLLQVSKQIFEAMPVLYSTNDFIFPSIQHLLWFLETIPTTRREHIEHISFDFSHGDDKLSNAAFKVLKDITHLRKLDISINEDYWTKLQKAKSAEPKYPDILKFPGIFTMRNIRGLKAVRFHGDCERLKTLVPEMTKEKPAMKNSRKRKAKTADKVEVTDGQVDGREMHPRTYRQRRSPRMARGTAPRPNVDIDMAKARMTCFPEGG